MPPDSPHRKKFAHLIAFSLDFYGGAFANIVCSLSEDPPLNVFLFTTFFILSIFALDMIITMELLLQAYLKSSPLPISCCTQQTIYPTVSTSWLLVILVTQVAIMSIFALTAFRDLWCTASLIFFSLAMKNSITFILVLNAHLRILEPASFSALAG